MKFSEYPAVMAAKRAHLQLLRKRQLQLDELVEQAHDGLVAFLDRMIDEGLEDDS